MNYKKATELYKLGKTFYEISQILKRTERSVQLKLNKNGLYVIRKITTESKTCLFCNKEFISPIKDKRKFCSHRCSTIFNNTSRGLKTRITENVFCVNCGNKLNNHQYKYCSQNCQTEFEWKFIIKKIENNEVGVTQRNCKKYLIEKYGNECMECGWNKINLRTGLVPIQLEHVDGHSENNSLSNLKLLCPNCHSLTPTYGALNKGNGRKFRYKNK